MENKSILEDNDYLAFLGIYIPKKESFPTGYIKLYPEDFIVEEIDERGRVVTIDRKDNTSPSLPEASKFFHATLVKCNMRTNEAIEEIVRQLGCNLKQVQTAGLKDEDAITAQKISFERIPLSAIKSLNSPYFFIKDIHVGDKRIYNGTHQGNKFTLLVRSAAESVNLPKNKESIFFNYYYTQRFAPRYASHVWGMYLLRGEYSQALKHFLTFDSIQEKESARLLRKEATEYYGNWEKMEEVLLKDKVSFMNELKVVSALKKNSLDIVGALTCIEDQVKLWLYAFSSWLFNHKIKSYVAQADFPPSELPLFLSDKEEDWSLYQELVEKFGLISPSFDSIRPFSSVVVRSNNVPTTASAFIHNLSKVPEGFIISFSLGKGSYATTFLSHHFNLASKKIPDNLKREHIDTKKLAGEASLDSVSEYFKRVL